MSLIQSNYIGFGSGLVARRTRLRAAEPRHAVRPRREAPQPLEPHKRPFHTIIPALVTKDGKPWFVFGVMGGDMQPQGHVQVLCNLIDFGMNVQEAGEAPRLEHVGSRDADRQAGRRGRRHGQGGGRHPGRGGRGAGAARPSGRAGRAQRRRLPGHPDRPEDRHAARRLGGAQGRLCGGVLAVCDRAFPGPSWSGRPARTACPAVPRPAACPLRLASIDSE